MIMKLQTRISPFAIQSFVTAGVSLNMSGLGLVMGFVSGLLPQLRQPASIIAIDDSSASWIASLPGFSVFVGNLIMPSIMSTYGRRKANLCSLAVSAVGWVSIVFSNSVIFLYLARILQGIGLGMTATLGPILIGEYTSPKNRGLFLMTISVAISAGVFVIQTLGSYLPWQICALICTLIVLFAVFLGILSPESPTFLADKERYDECRRIFTYLRGDTENDELEKMIAARMKAKMENVDTNVTESMREKILSRLDNFKHTLKKKEVYKPIFIMIHVYTIAHWCGINMLTSFTTDLFEKVVGLNAGIDIPLMIVIIGALRLVENIVGMVLIKTLRRRVMLFSTIGLNVFALLAVAAYTYARDNNWLPFDDPVIGLILVHIQMFSIAAGALPLTFVLAGELFPMAHKGLCGGISMMFFSAHLFSNVKTVLFFLNLWGIYGTYCLYAGLLIYCLIVIGVLLPETKDRTLQDIEKEFRGIKTTSF